MKKKIYVSLIGNPNSGKSSLFNTLTNLNQKTGNFPGVTVEKKLGKCEISKLTSIKSIQAEFIDLPGTYSLNPRNLNEETCVKNVLTNKIETRNINLIVIDSSNIKRGLFFASQIIELDTPSVIALNMIDIAEKEGLEINTKLLSKKLQTPIIKINAKKNIGIGNLKKEIFKLTNETNYNSIELFSKKEICKNSTFQKIQKALETNNNHLCINKIINHKLLNKKEQKIINNINDINIDKIESKSHILRFKYINKLYKDCVRIIGKNKILHNTIKLDNILIHHIYGYIIFFLILFCLFQAIFQLSSYPMEKINECFTYIGNQLNSINNNDNIILNILSDGIIPGLGGVMMFVPQIAILFLLISILEETGYMSRISYLMDKSMRKIGLNGKSIIPLLSGFSCAIPAIMSVRNIENKKHKFITLLIIPLMSCSARLPVYTLMIALVIPKESIFGLGQGLVFLGVYLLGLGVSILIAIIINKTMKNDDSSRNKYLLELPRYKNPYWKSIFINVFQKIKFFIIDVGKVIILISIIIWALMSHGPKKENDKINYFSENVTLENSYAGKIGKTIEPVIKPLGYDWKVGISLITSFAAREVFVGTMATLYNSNNSNNIELKETLKNYKDPITNKKFFTLPVGLSILIFYVFALQCMSTLAIMYKETNSWKLPALQFILFLTLAYIFSFLAYQTGIYIENLS